MLAESSRVSISKVCDCGDGPDRIRLSKMTTSKDVLSLLGSLGGHELATAYASADVFTFASQADTFGNVVLEAIASGLPVIAYDYVCAHTSTSNIISQDG